MQFRTESSSTPPTDETLLQLVANQDVAAYEALYQRHGQTMFNLIVRIVRDQEVAAELLQEVFWQVWQNAGQYRGEGAAAAWMYRIARNRSLDQLRRQKSRPQSADISVEVAQTLGNEYLHSAEEVAEIRLRQAHVQDALLAIPEEQRICLELAYFEGMSQTQIAEETNTALGTIKSRIRIGLERLERTLRGSGYP